LIISDPSAGHSRCDLDIVERAIALEYKWTPDFSPLDFAPEEDVQVLRFLYGATLAGAFAQMAGVGHVFQPKRAHALLAASLHADADLAGRVTLA